MRRYLVDFRDLQFNLFEFLELERMNAYPRYRQFDRDDYEEALSLAGRIAAEYVFPANVAGHREGCGYDPVSRSVKLPGGYREAARALLEAGFMGISDDPAIGGTGMPLVMQACTWEVFCGAGGALMLFLMLGHGAAHMIQRFGTDEQRKCYVGRLLSGEWGGTMCLTEPEAGSDVGSLKTRAESGPDGTYRITGQKCFITNGEQDITDQIIYPVLARVEGDPPGTKGISLFIVPKFLPDGNGNPGERNDVCCLGIEEKMGAHGAATCSMAFGEEGRCTGFLLGERGRGMNIMFQMLNETRLEVGIMALGGSACAFLQAVDYARTRLQGPHFSRMFDPSAPRVPIIEHPDVMRMLLGIKACVEAERMLSYYTAMQIDLHGLLEGEEAREAGALADILIPLVKAGNTDNAWNIISEAIQVHGGNGYCEDYPVGQLAVDCRALGIVEGTNGIQSLDLVMRKILLNPDHENYRVLKSRMRRTIGDAKGVVDDVHLRELERGIGAMDEAVAHMKRLMDEGLFQALLLNVDPLRRAMFDLVLAWMHVYGLRLTLPRLGAVSSELLEENREAAFYYGKVRASEYWLASEFTKYFGKIDAVLRSGEVDLLPGNAAFASLPGG